MSDMFKNGKWNLNPKQHFQKNAKSIFVSAMGGIVLANLIVFTVVAAKKSKAGALAIGLSMLGGLIAGAGLEIGVLALEARSGKSIKARLPMVSSVLQQN